MHVQRIVASFFLCLVSLLAHAGKSAPPQPTGCLGADFPSVAISQFNFKRSGAFSGATFSIGNAAGNCRINLYTSTKITYAMRFRMDESTGTIVWIQSDDDGAFAGHYVIKRLNFTVSEGRVVEALPLVPATIYVDPGVNTDTNTNPDYGAIQGLDFSPAGDQLVFQRVSHPDGTTRLMEVLILDLRELAGCPLNCPTKFVHLANGSAPRGVAWPVADRIYYILRSDPLDASTACVFAIDQVTGWSAPQSILCANDGPADDSARGFSTYLDNLHFMPGSSGIVAVNRLAGGNIGSPWTQLFDVSGCSPTTGTTGSCFANGGVSSLGTGVEGDGSGWAPDRNLLRTVGRSSDATISTVDFGGVTITPHGAGYRADGAD